MELYCGDTKLETRGQRKNHLTVLAESQEGYRSLLQTVSQGFSDFYFEPTVDGANLAEHKKGLVILSGCTGSLLATSLIGGKNVDEADASYDLGKQVAARFKKAFGDAYYLEVQFFPELEKSRQINQMLARMSGELHIPLVATGDVHYTKPSESEMQKILHNLRGGNKKTLEEMEQDWGYNIPLCPPITDKVVMERLRGTGLSKGQAIQAILNSEEIAQRCNVKIPVLPRLRFPLPHGYENTQAVWHDWLKRGLKYRGVNRMSSATRRRYHEKLQYEMSIIEQKDFIDYFLIVSDIVRFAKDVGIPVGPARGSAAASLVCWLLRITEVNPMLFPGLVFERFIDLTREDLPDIDLDFDSERRGEIEEYAVSKYGRACVGNIGTFTYFRSKNSLDDVARVYKIPQYEVDTVKGLLLERSSGDLRASATIEDTVEQFEQAKDVFDRFPDLAMAYQLEGNIKGMGIHAAGLIVSNGPLTDVCATYERNVNGVVRQVISLDKHDAERQNLVKIDVLGLSTMTMIAEALRILGMKLTDLYKIPLDDPEVIAAFQRNDVVGIFQFDGRAMRSVNAELQPDSFKEVCDVNALARPGPLHNNASAMYIDVKRGNIDPPKLHPLYDAIAAETNYQIVYQEQILRIVREVGGFDWTAAAYIRKIISKKLGEQEFVRQWERFWSGAEARGVPEETARKIWGLCITAGSYAFNTAHCVTGDTVVRVAGGRPSSEKYPNAQVDFTVRELWDRMHGLPMRKTQTGRYNRFDGPCMRCGVESEKYHKGWCGRCASWRSVMFTRGLKVLAWDPESNRIKPDKIVDVIHNGTQCVTRMKLSGGKEITATPTHRILTMDGWKNLGSLQVGEKVAVDAGRDDAYHGQNRLTEGERAGVGFGTAVIIDGSYKLWQTWRKQVKEECGMCGAWHRRLETSHQDGNRKNNAWTNLKLLCPECHRKYDTEENGSCYVSWSQGHLVGWSVIESLEDAGEREVFDLQMEGDGENFVGNGIVVHNSTAYGMLAFWTMWLKVHHPQVFYVACLKKMGSDHQLEYLRDAMKKGIQVLPPHPGLSLQSWIAEGSHIRAGFEQIPGIGNKMAPRIVEERTAKGMPADECRWSDLLAIKGIGPKKINTMAEFSESEDPFMIHWLHRRIEKVKNEIRSGALGDLPRPTHTSLEVPYRRGSDTPVVWIGILKHRNLRDLFEANFARTGVALDPETVKNPDLREWVIGIGADEDELVTLTWDRWMYPKVKKGIWGIKLDSDLVLIKGVKKGFQARRAIYVKQFWVLNPDK